jgi:hypothetical protein
MTAVQTCADKSYAPEDRELLCQQHNKINGCKETEKPFVTLKYLTLRTMSLFQLQVGICNENSQNAGPLECYNVFIA